MQNNIEPIEVEVSEADIRATRHLFAVDAPVMPERRRGPRRQAVEGCVSDRRQTDRRKRQPGIDGLMRTVLSDIWE